MPKIRIGTKILAVFLGLFLVSFLLLGYAAFNSIEGLGDYAMQRSTSLGESAINDSTSALENLGVQIIEQKAKDVARQCEIYIKYHPDMTVADLQASAEFQEIAVQPVGETGYTALADYETLICRFHKSQGLVDFDLHTLAQKLPGFWGVMGPTQGGKISFGYYDWEEPDGTIRKKYMYITPINAKTAGGIGMHVAATTYIDEFSKSVKETRNTISAATSDTNKHINRQIDGTLNTFIGILIAMILVVAGCSFLLSRMITNPIKELSKGSKVIGCGDFDHRVVVKTGDELEDLANSLNKMASDLKRYMNELVEKETRIRELEIERLEKYSKNLERKVKLLEIKVDREKTEKAVSKITETEYFKKLRTEAADIREKRKKA
jgi:methyl-accepting chemotaxis protein